MNISSVARITVEDVEAFVDCPPYNCCNNGPLRGDRRPIARWVPSMVDCNFNCWQCSELYNRADRCHQLGEAYHDMMLDCLRVMEGKVFGIPAVYDSNLHYGGDEVFECSVRNVTLDHFPPDWEFPREHDCVKISRHLSWFCRHAPPHFALKTQYGAMQS